MPGAADADRFVPVAMVHGCCLSSKTWETTPDGRMGWDEYFVRLGRAVYLADQVSRERPASRAAMQDRNRRQVADLIAAWIDSHVERKARG